MLMGTPGNHGAAVLAETSTYGCRRDRHAWAPSFPVRAMDEEDKRFLPLGPAANPLTADMPHGWSTGRSNAARIRHVTERDSPGAVRPSARKCESEAVVMRTAGFLPTPQRWCSGLFILGIGDPALRPGKT